MNKCKGWFRLEHDTSEVLVPLFTLGCNDCGGHECGDTPELLELCSECLIEYKKEQIITERLDY